MCNASSHFICERAALSLALMLKHTFWVGQRRVAVLCRPLLADVLYGVIALLVIPASASGIGVHLDTALSAVTEIVGLSIPPVCESHGGPIRPLKSLAVIEFGEPDPMVPLVARGSQEICYKWYFCVVCSSQMKKPKIMKNAKLFSGINMISNCGTFEI